VEYSIVEGEVVLIDNDGNVLSTISGANGSKLEVATELSTVIDSGAIKVKEQNIDSNGYIRNSSHNMAYKNGAWSPFTLDSQGRLKVVTSHVAEPHTLSGTSHIGMLSDVQIPGNIVRDYKLITVSGILRYDIEHIDCGHFL